MMNSRELSPAVLIAPAVSHRTPLLPVSIFRSRGNFFSRGTREKKNQGTEIGQREEKTLPKSRKKEAKICTTFRNEVQKTIYLLVVYKRGFSTEFSF